MHIGFYKNNKKKQSKQKKKQTRKPKTRKETKTNKTKQKTEEHLGLICFFCVFFCSCFFSGHSSCQVVFVIFSDSVFVFMIAFFWAKIIVLC
jgi:hypothetical protein